jgi:hypothetical protein
VRTREEEQIKRTGKLEIRREIFWMCVKIPFAPVLDPD